MYQPLCIGHRGARGYKPENTLASFAHALALGCPWVELDVYAVDGELLVIHDKSVDRTTNGSGLIRDMSLEELRRLDAGDGQKIPTLDEVIALIDQRCGINVELKGPDTVELVNRALDRYVTAGWEPGAFLVSSFNHEALSRTGAAYRRGALFPDLPDDWLARALALGAWSVNFEKKDVTAGLVTTAHEADLKVLVYTVNEPADIRRIINTGADGIFSDFPDRVLAETAG